MESLLLDWADIKNTNIWIRILISKRFIPRFALLAKHYFGFIVYLLIIT